MQFLEDLRLHLGKQSEWEGGTECYWFYFLFFWVVFLKERNLKMEKYTSGSMSTYELLIALLYLDCVVYQPPTGSVLSCRDIKGGFCQLLQKQDSAVIFLMDSISCQHWNPLSVWIWSCQHQTPWKSPCLPEWAQWALHPPHRLGTTRDPSHPPATSRGYPVAQSRVTLNHS